MYEDRNKRLYAYKSHLCICLQHTNNYNNRSFVS
uniref:Uncharacterized protein n=1 Tax=Anguilla anguilla TaxID=7936 RepID=A0A0E9PNW8_ANGAN